MVEENNLKKVFPYLGNITICGKGQEEHVSNLTTTILIMKRTLHLYVLGPQLAEVLVEAGHRK